MVNKQQHFINAVFTSAERRIDEESFASVTSRGNGTRLISDKNGGNVTAKIMKDIYKWECVKSLYTTTCAYNMNEVEKQVHKLLFENEMSIWLRNGAGGVQLGKGKCSNSHSQLFTDPVRASVLPPRIHANCLTDETFLIYDDDILCFQFFLPSIDIPRAWSEDLPSAGHRAGCISGPGRPVYSTRCRQCRALRDRIK